MYRSGCSFIQWRKNNLRSFRDLMQVTTSHYRLFASDARVYTVHRQSNRARMNNLNAFVVNTMLSVPSHSIVETAFGTEDFSSLVAADLAADPTIASALPDESKVYTVFGPINTSFADLLTALGVGSM